MEALKLLKALCIKIQQTDLHGPFEIFENSIKNKDKEDKDKEHSQCLI